MNINYIVFLNAILHLRRVLIIKPLSAMPFRVIMLFFSTLGIIAVFLPWLFLPKTGDAILGYRADGIVTGLLFLIILLYTATAFRRPKLSYYTIGGLAGLGLLLFYITLDKILSMEATISNYHEENPLLATSLAGIELGLGVYLSGVAGAGIFLTAIAIAIEQIIYKGADRKSSPIHNYHKGVIGLFLLLAIGSVGFMWWYSRPVDLTILQSKIAQEVTQVGDALSQADYNKFIAYNHIIMVNSLGGKDKMKSLIEDTVHGLKENGTTIKAIELDSISDLKQEARTIQAVLIQSVIFITDGTESKDVQKMLAVSNDKGKSFQFINITNKSRQDIIKFFPDLIPQINI